MAKSYIGNATRAAEIVKDPVAQALKFIEVYDLDKTTEEQLEQWKADLKLAFNTTSDINGQMVCGDRQVMVESKTVGGGFNVVTHEAVKDVLRGADLLEVTTTVVDAEKLNEMADRYEKRGNKVKATQIRNLLTRQGVTTQLSIAIRKVGATVTPTSDATAPARKGKATVI